MPCLRQRSVTRVIGSQGVRGYRWVKPKDFFVLYVERSAPKRARKEGVDHANAQRQSISRSAARAKVRSGTIERLVSELALQPGCESRTSEAADMGRQWNGLLFSTRMENRVEEKAG